MSFLEEGLDISKELKGGNVGRSNQAREDATVSSSLSLPGKQNIPQLEAILAILSTEQQEQASTAVAPPSPVQEQAISSHQGARDTQAGKRAGVGRATRTARLYRAGRERAVGSLLFCGTLKSRGSLTNNGTLRYPGSLSRRGTLDGHGSLTNNGTLRYPGSLSRHGTLDRHGSLV